MALRRVTGQEDGSLEAENNVEDENETGVSIFLNASIFTHILTHCFRKVLHMVDSQDYCNKSSVIWLTRSNRDMQGSQRVTALSSMKLKRRMKFGDVKNVCLYVLKGPLKTLYCDVLAEDR